MARQIGDDPFGPILRIDRDAAGSLSGLGTSQITFTTASTLACFS
jgi:hypothetical protein